MPVDGQLGAPRNIAGNYHTVNPLAINSQVLNVFTENKRTITLIDSPQFGTVAYIAIGATLVGSIIHTCDEGDTLKRGDEVGYFAFGGSTIITLFTKGAIKFDDDLLLNSAQPLETLVRVRTPVSCVSL
jgi:phosphatidylserine decarboxylase